MKTLVKIVFGIFGLVVVLAIIGSMTNSTPQGAVQPTANAPAAQAPAQPTAMDVAIPADEQNFVNIISTYTNQYNAAANDMAKGAVRTARRQALCAAFPTLHVANWVGVISTLDSTGSGQGVLGLNINSNVSVSTSNNDISDSIDHTTIPASSALFKAVSQMKTGDTVYFSGDFQQSDDDCFNEVSITTDGSMQQPEFDFRFTAVKEAAQP